LISTAACATLFFYSPPARLFKAGPNPRAADAAHLLMPHASLGNQDGGEGARR
jgi:hypothetical protein